MKTGYKYAVAALIFLQFIDCGFVEAKQETSELGVSIFDQSGSHIYPEGVPFTLGVAVSFGASESVSYQWRDANGAPLTSAVAFPKGSEQVFIKAPSGERGYYGLVLTPSANMHLPNRQPGEAREYGFVILPSPEKNDPADSPFGTVHADLKDLYLPSWTKTATWRTYALKDWRDQMEKRRQQDKIELPIISGEEWKTDDNIPVDEENLQRIQEKARDYFSADPKTVYWEAGIEENLGKAYHQQYYWDNLYKKMQVLRRAAKEARVPVRFIYQIATTNPDGAKMFLQSEASKAFDILSLHPYAWPNFETPDSWLENFIKKTKQIERENNRALPIWFTEVGAPDFGNYEGGFFGYPKLNRPTGGLSRAQMASFLVKTCVISLSKGVEKVFWYNYRDAGSARDQVEMHFGLKDYLGYPKPAYAAYVNVSRMLASLKAISVREEEKGLRVYEFSKGKRHVFIVWTTGIDESLSPHEISETLRTPKGITVTDMVGHPKATQNGQIKIGSTPIFVGAQL